MRSSRHGFVAALLAALLFAPTAAAQVPGTLVHQGRLLDGSGAGINGIKILTFRIYGQQTGGEPLYEETRNVLVSNGFYTERLGAGGSVPLDAALLASGTLWLELTVGDTTLTPRHRIESVPYAILANTAENVDGGYVDATQVTVNGTTVIDESGQWVGPPPAGTLGALSCDQEGATPKWVGGQWTCLPDADALAGLTCQDPTAAPKWLDGQWECVPDTLVGISCAAEGATLKWLGGQWTCSEDVDSDTLAALSCEATEGALKWRDGQWVCEPDVDSDTLAALACQDPTAALRWLDGQWECVADTLVGATCAEEGATLKWLGGQWECVADTLVGATCAEEGATLKWRDGQWACELDVDSDTFAETYCVEEGATLKWRGGQWVCEAEADTLAALEGCQHGWVAAYNAMVQQWQCHPMEDFPRNLECDEGEVLTMKNDVWHCGKVPQDSDTLAHLPCAPGEVAKWSEGEWSCAPDADTLVALNCSEGQFPKLGADGWACVDFEDADGLGYLTQYGNCQDGDVVRWDGELNWWVCDRDADSFAGMVHCQDGGSLAWSAEEQRWNCVPPPKTDGLVTLVCPPSWVPTMDESGKWTCQQDADTLGKLNCAEGEIARRIDGKWACSSDGLGGPIGGPIDPGGTPRGGTMVPLGTRIVWWNFSGAEELPYGFQPAGTVVDAPGSPLDGMTLPEAGEDLPPNHVVLYKVVY